MVVPIYNAELAPKTLRGRLVSLNQLAITAGIMVSRYHQSMPPLHRACLTGQLPGEPGHSSSAGGVEGVPGNTRSSGTHPGTGHAPAS